MVKQKIHTARNQTYKNHRNGIKRPKTQRYRSQKGVRWLQAPRFVVVALSLTLRSPADGPEVPAQRPARKEGLAEGGVQGACRQGQGCRLGVVCTLLSNAVFVLAFNYCGLHHWPS